MKRRKLVHFLGLSIGLGACVPVLSQTKKEKKDINLIVPFPAGGGGDNFARSVSEEFSKKIGESVWIANRPGAGGNIGTNAVVGAKPDGTTLGYITNGIMCVNEHLYKKTPFKASEDLIPVGQLSRIGLVMVLNPKAIPGVTDLQELIEFAKKHPGAVNYASSGVGTTSHLAGRYFEQQAGVEMMHIPHSGGAAAIVEVLSGRIPVMIDVSANVLQHIGKGSLKALAVTTPERLAALPDVPTMKEAGIDGYELYAWDGFVLPRGASPETVLRFSRAFQAIGEEPSAREKIKKLGAEPIFSSAGEFETFIQNEKPKWDNLVRTIAPKSN